MGEVEKMDEVCDYIKSVGDEDLDDTSYIDFSSSEEIDWSQLTSAEFIDYVSSTLKSRLGDDIEIISGSIVDNRLSLKFLFKDLKGEIWEWYNSRDYHFWVVSFAEL